MLCHISTGRLMCVYPFTHPYMQGEVLGLIHTQSKSYFSWCQNNCNGTTPPGRVINCLKESIFSFPVSSCSVLYPLISLDLVSIYLPDQRASPNVWLVLIHNLPLRLYLKLVSLGWINGAECQCGCQGMGGGYEERGLG